MNAYYYSLFLLFIILATIITIDSNVATYIVLFNKYLKQKIFKFKWWLFNSPDNPIVSYLSWRRSIKLAKQIQQEMMEKSKKNS